MVFPAAVATEHGTAVAYYDWRNADGGKGTDVYVTFGFLDASDARDVRVSEVTTSWPDLPADAEHAVVQRNVGDYLGVAAQGRRVVVAWTDGRTGRSLIMARVLELP
jgi:hypothetical protein